MIPKFIGDDAFYHEAVARKSLDNVIQGLEEFFFVFMGGQNIIDKSVSG